MKKMKIAVLALFAAATGATVQSWAFTSQGISTVTAGTFVGGAKVARFSLNIKNTANPFGANRSSVTWSSVAAGDGWKIADQLLVIRSTVTDSNGGVQIYTDNTASDAVPQFLDPTPGPTPSNLTNPDSAAGGLLRGNAAGTTSEVLPMAWSIKSTTRTVESGDANTGIGATDPNNGADTGLNNRHQWLFIADKSNTAGIDYNQDGDVIDAGDAAPFVNGDVFLSMVRVGGIHVQQNPASIELRADGLASYVYLQANFAAASAQQAYQTTTLRVEAFIQ